MNPSSLQGKRTGREYIPIFPFGCNNSQYKAVKNAMENQISVIQGPPGTGKTQTILNIIANILMQGETVQIVSNNNSATENVYEKLSSPKYNLGFVAATLGSSKNKKLFVEHQDAAYPDFSSWKTGEDPSVLQKEIAEQSSQLKSVFDKQEKEILLEQRSVQDKSKYLQDGISCFKEFNLNSHKEWTDVSVDLNNEKGHYKELLEAQKNNAEFMALNERVSVLGNQLEIKKKDLEENIKQKIILETTVSEKKKLVKDLKEKEIEKQAELNKERIVGNSSVEKAIEEYDQYLSGDNQNGGLMVRATKERVDRRVREIEGSQIKASIRVNNEMLMYYWSVGKDITERRADSKWGNKFFQNMSMDMSDMIPNAKGFSPTNLRYMMRFYGLYKDIVIVPQVGERLLENNGNQIVPQVEED